LYLGMMWFVCFSGSLNKSRYPATVSVAHWATATVTANFSGLPQDETITLTGTENLSWSANTTLSVSVSETFTGYQWYLDGTALTGATTGSLTMYAEDLSLKKHTLTVYVTKGGVKYAVRNLYR
jgi:hypothetical protein